MSQIIYDFLTDPLTKTILQPVIVGITIQAVAHWLKVKREKEVAVRYALLLYNELRTHQLTYDSLLSNPSLPTKINLTYGQLDTTIWNNHRHLLVSLPERLFDEITLYYIAVKGYNVVMPHVDEASFPLCLEAIKENSASCATITTSLLHFLQKQSFYKQHQLQP